MSEQKRKFEDATLHKAEAVSEKYPFIKPYVEGAIKFFEAGDLHASRGYTDILGAALKSLDLVGLESLAKVLPKIQATTKEMSREALEAHFIAFTLEQANMKSEVMIQVEGLVAACGGRTEVHQVREDGTTERVTPTSTTAH